MFVVERDTLTYVVVVPAPRLDPPYMKPVLSCHSLHYLESKLKAGRNLPSTLPSTLTATELEEHEAEVADIVKKIAGKKEKPPPPLLTADAKAKKLLGQTPTRQMLYGRRVVKKPLPFATLLNTTRPLTQPPPATRQTKASKPPLAKPKSANGHQNQQTTQPVNKRKRQLESTPTGLCEGQYEVRSHCTFTYFVHIVRSQCTLTYYVHSVRLQ